MNCPECGSSKTKVVKTVPHKGGVATYWRCKTCGAGWQTG
jgi:transposase-like protein